MSITTTKDTGAALSDQLEKVVPGTSLYVHLNPVKAGLAEEVEGTDGAGIATLSAGGEIPSWRLTTYCWCTVRHDGRRFAPPLGDGKRGRR